ncbi:unnamed protein product [Dibothriocephalus latus]|uniref:Uncharacterized protein n=1 Tax=Dibothriocephalus latus TaxID=60516 RepID=A0A3P6T955_DIBLA|nr:unnamed protein product [Dibothriocephalus latus]
MVVTLKSKTLPYLKLDDPKTQSYRFLPWQWVFQFHYLTSYGCIRPVCDSNSKWCEKAANDLLDVFDVRDRSPATTIFATDEDIKEGQLLVLFLLHRKLYVRNDAVEMFLEREHLITFDDDEGIILIPRPEFWSLLYIVQ